jgi:VanZ family protein/UDP-2,3-diacylglucosamine pyrophosphatase LpxH
MRRTWTWAPPALIATAIVWLSHQSKLPTAGLLIAPWDKVAHILAFASLAFTLDRAFRKSRHDWPMYRRHLWVFLGVTLFGAMDEWHQSFVPGREVSGLDWLADVVGAKLGLLAAVWPFLMGGRSAEFGWWRGGLERPDPERPLIIVADPHWGEELTGLREVTRQYPEADWLFLGDIFDVWVGLPGMETESQRSFLWWVQDRRVARRWIGLWMGNRDYFLDRLAPQFDLIGEGIGGGLPAEGLRFEHGDLVQGADRTYRFWNLVSRSAPVWLLVALLPPVLAQRLARYLERSLRTTNRTYRVTFPQAPFQNAVAEAPERTLLTGHFHTHHTEGAGVAIPWAHEGAFALWESGRLSFLAAPVRSDATFLPMAHP